MYLFGSFMLTLAFAGTMVANLFYQNLLLARAWPPIRIHDQVVVTESGDVFVKIKDPIIGRADRVQLYDCNGKFKAAFQPDSAGGVFKIAASPDQSLEIYSVRTNTVDTFALDGTFLRRRSVDDRDMPFDFLKSGPSVRKAGLCEFEIDPVSSQFSVRNGTSIKPLEPGDWILENLLNFWGIGSTGALGIGLILVSTLRRDMSQT